MPVNPMPQSKPQSPLFGSGPTKKFPGWQLESLSDVLVGRSHRSLEGVRRLNEIINLTKSVLAIPADYEVAILPGSATGAIECALWTLLGSRGVDVFAWDVFGKLWVTDVMQQLPLPDQRLFTTAFGNLPDLGCYDPGRDTIFTWNGTSSGVCVPDLNWISETRQGLTICDATSAAFAVELDWHKLDATGFSWQKGLGGEAAHGMLVLSPRALQQLQRYTPSWPIPRLFRLTKDHKIIDGIFEGKTINTPSMLCVQDCLQALSWAADLGGIKALAAKTRANFTVIEKWIQGHSLLKFMAVDKRTISPVSVCLELCSKRVDSARHTEIIMTVASKLATLGVAYEIKNHYLAPPSFRIWCGPTVEESDLVKLIPWIDWALTEILNK